jgi:hypothetical protein
MVVISDTAVVLNQAQGGLGGNGGTDSQLQLTGSGIAANTAQGGAGGDGIVNGQPGNGGNASGGGIFVAAQAVLDAIDSIVSTNQAIGGIGGYAGVNRTPGTTGAGIGGGLYLTSRGSRKQNTLVAINSASTSDDDIFGPIDDTSN